MSNGIEELKQVSEVLAQAKEVITEILEGTQHGATSALIGHSLDQLVNRVHFLGGSAPVTTATTEFPPITEFMGEPITRSVPITEQALTPGQLERQIYTDKVEALYDVIESMFPDKILNSYTIPEDVLVLRGVAKKADVKDFATAPLNIPFVEAIYEGIAAKRLAEEKQQEFEANLVNEENAKRLAEEKQATKPVSNEPATGANVGTTGAGLASSETTTVAAHPATTGNSASTGNKNRRAS